MNTTTARAVENWVDEKFVTTEVVAEFIGKPTSWLYNTGRTNGLPRYKIGNGYRYLLSEVRDWLRGQAA